MNETDRRDVLRSAGLAVTAAAIGDPLATTPARAQVPKAALKQAELPDDLTRKLARFIISARIADMPDAVRHEAKRTLLNWVGCALGGSQHETVVNAIAALSAFFGARQATLLGRPERPDVLHAALLNGISSHVLDFDDTHAQTTIHPAAPVAPAILALAEFRPVSGENFIEALVIGVETECRIGKAVVPAHYDRGWHITGRRVRRRCGGGKIAGPGRTANVLGAWSCGDPAGGTDRDVRFHDQELPSGTGGAKRACGGVPRRQRFHRVGARPRSPFRLA